MHQFWGLFYLTTKVFQQQQQKNPQSMSYSIPTVDVFYNLWDT